MRRRPTELSSQLLHNLATHRNVILVTIWAITPCIAARGSNPTRHPNIVLILTDDQGYGDLRSNGNPKIDTPVLDRLAATSTRFERFFVCPLCTPTRATLLSGRYYLRTGAISVTRGLETMRSGEITIAEVLKTAGYATGCFGKWHLGEHYPNHPNGQGFDEFFGFPTGHWDNYFNPRLDHNGRMVPTKGYITDVLTDAAIRFIKINRSRPFFCYVPYNAPHTPLQVPDRFFNKYKARGLNDRTAALYGMVENIDGNVKRLLKTLDDLELASNTVVFFLSDNGAEGPQGSRYNAGMRGMKGSVHEGGVRVPLFVRWPGHIKANRTIKQIAAHIDLLPTIAELAGATIPPSQHLDGRSLVPLLTGSTGSIPTDRMIFTRTPGWRRLVGYKGPVVKNLRPFPAAVRTQHWRMVHEGSRWQLFDMTADPGETKDVAADHPQVIRQLDRAYRNWFADVTRTPIERPPISVGYPQRPSVELPAPEAYFTGTIHWYNKWGFAHDWLTGWSNVKDTIWWDINVVHGGRYEVTLMYTCPPKSVGTTLLVETAKSSVTGRISKAYNPKPRQRPSRQTKRRFIQTFASMKLGTVDLRKGRGRITIRAITRPGDHLCDLQSIRLRRIE